MCQSAVVVFGPEVRGFTAKEHSRERGCHRARKGMSVMFSKITRLELGIVVAVLLVLFLCRQPPKSGNADVRRDAEPTPQQPVRDVEEEGPNTLRSTAPDSQSESRSPQMPTLQPPTGTALAPATASHNGTVEPQIPAPRMKPLGVVDARKCPGLNYDDVLYGEVTVRMVWDGARFVWRKVVVVREKSGAISTWTFDERDDIVMTEIPQQAP